VFVQSHGSTSFTLAKVPAKAAELFENAKPNNFGAAVFNLIKFNQYILNINNMLIVVNRGMACFYCR
jgi:hypothetical protein